MNNVEMEEIMIKEAIQKAVTGKNLTFAEAEAVMDEIMSGQASQIQMSADRKSVV